MEQVDQTMHIMAEAVRAGDFDSAEEAGRSAPLPLSLEPGLLRRGPLLSSTAHSQVWQAELLPTGQDARGAGGVAVALKQPRVRRDADLDAFRREVAILAGLAHPHLATLVGARLLPPQYFLVMAWERGGNLAKALEDPGWVPGWRGLCALGAQLATALAHLHAHGIVHR